MNTDKPDFLAVIAEADPCGEGGAWLLSVGSGWLVASSMGKRDKSAMPYCPSRFAVNYGLEDGNIEGPQLRRFLQHQLGLTGVTGVTSLRMRWDDCRDNQSRREVLFATTTVIRKW